MEREGARQWGRVKGATGTGIRVAPLPFPPMSSSCMLPFLPRASVPVAVAPFHDRDAALCVAAFPHSLPSLRSSQPSCARLLEKLGSAPRDKSTSKQPACLQRRAPLSLPTSPKTWLTFHCIPPTPSATTGERANVQDTVRARPNQYPWAGYTAAWGRAHIPGLVPQPTPFCACACFPACHAFFPTSREKQRTKRGRVLSVRLVALRMRTTTTRRPTRAIGRSHKS